jgi:toxin-antitoxin system PIN domain toxin
MIGLDTSVLVAAAIGGHPQHDAVWKWMREALDAGDSFGITSGILAEFIHVATDPRRFENPLSVADALEWAHYWCNAEEMMLLHPDDSVNAKWLAWLTEFRLGRKRLLDTLIAAIWNESGISKICTLNPADFTVFGVFEITQITSPSG